MTDIEYRNSTRRDELKELIAHPCFAEAKRLILSKLSGSGSLLKSDSPEIVSVRFLSTRVGMEVAFEELEALTQPVPEQVQEPESDFGQPTALAALDPQQL